MQHPFIALLSDYAPKNLKTVFMIRRHGDGFLTTSSTPHEVSLVISITRILAHLHISKQVSIPPTSPEVVHELEIPLGGSKTTHKKNKTGASRYHCTRHSIGRFARAYSTLLPQETQNLQRGSGDAGNIIRGASWIQAFSVHIIPAYLGTILAISVLNIGPISPRVFQIGCTLAQ